MLASQHRFHGLNSLSYAYKRGQVIRGSHMALKYVHNQRRQSYRAAVVVSRKVDKSAVVRNRIRRRVYEAIRAFQGELQQPYDLVFTVYHAQVATVEQGILLKQVGDLLRRSGALDAASAQTTPVHGIVNSNKTKQ